MSPKWTLHLYLLNHTNPITIDWIDEDDRLSLPYWIPIISKSIWINQIKHGNDGIVCLSLIMCRQLLNLHFGLVFLFHLAPFRVIRRQFVCYQLGLFLFRLRMIECLHSFIQSTRGVKRNNYSINSWFNVVMNTVNSTLLFWWIVNYDKR